MIRYIDLFCGVGGFRIAGDTLGWKCVFSSDIDKHCQEVYQNNFGELPSGDIRNVNSEDIPQFDVLLAGFPCQPFSIIGERKGLEDERGTLFFEILRIAKHHLPKAIIMENVKQLATHNKGKTISLIQQNLIELGYSVNWKIFNAMNFGLPQKRERVIIVAWHGLETFSWPNHKHQMTPLENILESDIPKEYYVSKRIKEKRQSSHVSNSTPSIWHENKSGHISSYKYSCALRANASYNYLLVDGERRLTSREMFRLQGFPEWFKPHPQYSKARAQAGNAVPVPMVKAVLESLRLGIDSNNGSERKEINGSRKKSKAA